MHILTQVPVGDYTIPLGVGKIVRQGKDVTLVGWGGQILVLMKAAEAAEKIGIQCEVIDLRSLLPWDEDIVVKSAMKTGRVIVSHEAPVCHVMLCFFIIIIIHHHHYYHHYHYQLTFQFDYVPVYHYYLDR